MRAALEICREQGYARLTMEGVAAKAGVGKQTIYRWWPSKGTVVLDAFLEELGPAIEVPPTTDELADLRLSLRRAAELLSHPRYGSMLADLVGALQHDEALAAEFHKRVYQPVRQQTVERIERARLSGAIGNVDTGLAADLLFGPLWFRTLLTRQPPTPDYADQIVDIALAGLCAATS